MTMLKLGDELKLPTTAITSTFGILAVRGAGKSNTAAVMAEEMFAHALPFVVVDPVGAWWGLRSTDTGKSAGLPIAIFGGKHGDVPLERGAGVMLADLIIEKRLSCVLDLSQFSSEGDKKKFLLEFAQRLYQKNENPLHLFLEEADDYIPQKPMRDEAQLLRAWENIVRRGRGRGLGMTMITQRSAAINKNVLTQVETLIAMRTTGPQDIAAIENWVKYNQQSTELLTSLPGLNDGEAWVWSPHFLKKPPSRHQIRRRHTFDSGATPKNMKADQGKPMATLADIDLTALQHQMAATIEKAKADDPRELRKQLAEAVAEIRTLKAAQPKTKETVKEVPVLKGHDIERVEKFAKTGIEWAEKMIGASNALLETLSKVAGKQQSTLRRVPLEQPAWKPPRPDVSRRVPPSQLSTEGISGVQQRVLNALVWWESIGVMAPDKQQTGFIAGYRVTKKVGGTFGNILGELRSAGLIDYPSPRSVQLTNHGRTVAHSPLEVPTTDILQQAIKDRLDGTEARVLDVLIQAYPHALSKQECGARADYHVTEKVGGTFGNILGRLRSLGLIEYPSPGQVVAKPVLFLETQ